jgi:hypothetical protein
MEDDMTMLSVKRAPVVPNEPIYQFSDYAAHPFREARTDSFELLVLGGRVECGGSGFSDSGIS